MNRGYRAGPLKIWILVALILGAGVCPGFASVALARSCESLFSESNRVSVSGVGNISELSPVFAKDQNPVRPFPGGWFSRLSGWKRYEFLGAMTVTLEILKRFPPDQFYYVGIGRSPYLFLDLLSFMTGEKAVGLGPNRIATIVPISYNEYIARKPILNLTKQWKEALEPLSRGSVQDQAKLQQMLTRFLPSSEQLAGRKLLLMDFSDYGSSLAKFSVDLGFGARDHEILFISAKSHTDHWYLDLLGRTAFGRLPINWWQIGENPGYEAELRTRLPRVHGFILQGELGPLAYALDGGDYKSHAPFPHSVPKTGSRHEPTENLQVRPAYLKFAKHLEADLQAELRANSELRARAGAF